MYKKIGMDYQKTCYSMGQRFPIFKEKEAEGSLWIHFCHGAPWKEVAWGPSMSYFSNTANPESKRE